MDAVRPYQDVTEEELNGRHSAGGPLLPVLACTKLQMALVNSPLLPVMDAKRVMATLLAAHGHTTWEHAVHLTENSPCFRAVPDWLAMRTLAVIEHVKAEDARASLPWIDRALWCATDWAGYVAKPLLQVARVAPAATACAMHDSCTKKDV
eukprot:TRINITY_DN13999_c0_g1_i1.p2 TRINITY_DN13999_c0_g1~~TRINITY_DN13999_c0_g1_i1.p2  ORF type:complete len:151 (-),score=23.60 TRINITY_DN13999_c0_g1_i1:489-941(-)